MRGVMTVLDRLQPNSRGLQSSIKIGQSAHSINRIECFRSKIARNISLSDFAQQPKKRPENMVEGK